MQLDFVGYKRNVLIKHPIFLFFTGAMYKVFSALIIALSFAIDCTAQSEHEKVGELPDIVELRIVDPHTVFLRATTELRRLSPDGGWIEDRMHIQADTGEIKLNRDARPPNEIRLTIGEKTSNETSHGGSTFKLLAINRGAVTFRYHHYLRDGKEVDRDIVVRPYSAPNNRRESDADLPEQLRTLSPKELTRTNIVVIGTFDTGRTPCEFLPDGSHRWMLTTGFKVDKVIRGKVTTSYLEVHLNAFVDQNPMPLVEGEKYYLLLSADRNLEERLQNASPLHFREALNDDNVVAVLDLNGLLKSKGSNTEAK